MSLIVTGGAGFVGSHLVDRLAARNERVIALDNGSRGSWDNLSGSSRNIQIVDGDIRDPGILDRLFRGAKVVFHLAALSRVMDCELKPDDCFASNVLGTYNVLKAAQEAGVRRVVLASSREVYGEPSELPVTELAPVAPKNAYGTSKAVAEMYGKLFAARGVEVSILRLANVYGPRDQNRVIPSFLTRAAEGLPLIIYGGEQVIDFIYVDYVVDAFVRAGLGPYVHGPLNVGSGVGTTISQLARRIVSLLNADCTIDFVPSRDAEVSRFVADPQRAIDALGIPRNGDPLKHLAGARNWFLSQRTEDRNGVPAHSRAKATGIG